MSNLAILTSNLVCTYEEFGDAYVEFGFVYVEFGDSYVEFELCRPRRTAVTCLYAVFVVAWLEVGRQFQFILIQFNFGNH